MSRLIYCYAECHYAERRCAECRGALQPSLIFTSKAFQMLHSTVGSWPYLQALCKAAKACQGQTR